MSTPSKHMLNEKVVSEILQNFVVDRRTKYGVSIAYFDKKEAILRSIRNRLPAIILILCVGSLIGLVYTNDFQFGLAVKIVTLGIVCVIWAKSCLRMEILETKLYRTQHANMIFYSAFRSYLDTYTHTHKKPMGLLFESGEEDDDATDLFAWKTIDFLRMSARTANIVA
ncbi:MAG: hypothetical protein PHC51_05400 [bacterium]|nr:hypothetical protein [bacterium]